MNQARITKQVDELYKQFGERKFDLLMIDIEKADPIVITAFMMKLRRETNIDTKLEAIRDVCSATIHRKLSNDLISTLMRLDKSACFLAWVGIAVGLIGIVVGLIIGVAQIVMPFICRTPQ